MEAVDVINDRENLIPLRKLARMVKRHRRTLWRWWRYGLRDPRRRGQRIKLPTCLDGAERCTTMRAYKAFCDARDRAKPEED